MALPSSNRLSFNHADALHYRASAGGGRLGQSKKRPPTGADLLLKLLHGQFRDRESIGVAGCRSDLDDLARDHLAKRIVAIHQMELAQSALEGQVEDLPLFGREVVCRE